MAQFQPFALTGVDTFGRFSEQNNSTMDLSFSDLSCDLTLFSNGFGLTSFIVTWFEDENLVTVKKKNA